MPIGMKKLMTSFLLAGTTLVLAAQQTTTPAFNVNITPPSPEVANLGKYVEQPVNLSTGTPGISIPLHTIRLGDFELPISLGYHAGGVRVEEMAGTCGLGWSLNAGFSLSRAVRGSRDEYPVNGYLDNTDTFSSVNTFYANNLPSGAMSAALVSFVNAVASGNIDLEPDLFQYNLPGASGSFLLSRADKQVHTQLFSNLKFSYDRTDVQGVSGSFSQWRVTDEKGAVYVFGKNLAGTATRIENTSTTTVFNGSRGAGKDEYTAWFLTEIVLPGAADTVFFDYTPVLNQYNNRVNETLFLPASNDFPVNDEYVYAESRSSTFQIRSVYGRFGKVLFTYDTTGRQDLKGSFALKGIEVFDYTNTRIKKYLLKTSYFAAAPPPSPTSPVFDSFNCKRLKLDSVMLETAAVPRRLYAFDYDYNPATRLLPYRLSYSQDYWGYYNGRVSTTMVPRYPAQGSEQAAAMNAVTPQPWIMPGAVRSPAINFATIGTLTRMYYPTGGFTELTYAQNDAYGEDFDHEPGIPGEGEVSEQVYAAMQSNTILAPAFTGTVLTDTFTIDNGQMRRNTNFCRIDIDNPNACDFDNRVNTCGTKIELVKPSGEIALLPNRGSLYFMALNGQYLLRLTIAGKTNPNARDVTISITGPGQQAKLYNKKIGGLRVQETRQYDGIAPQPVLAKRYVYRQPADTAKSSGFFNYPGNFDYLLEINGTTINNMQTRQTVFARTASSNYPMLMQSGSPIIYEHVDVLEQTAGQQQKVSNRFAVFGDNFQPTLTYPVGPVLKNDHKKGQLLAQQTFLYQGGSFSLQQEQQSGFLYAADSGQNVTLHEGVKIAPLNRGGSLPVKQYIERTGWANPVQQSAKYYANGQLLGNTTDLYYDNPLHFLPTRQEKLLTGGEKLRQKTVYVQDYTLPATGSTDMAAQAIRNLRNSNYLLPIENLSIRQLPNGDEWVVDGSLTTYDSATLRPAVLYKLDLAVPVAFTAFTPSAITAGGLYIKDARYREVGRFVRYDNRGNILQMQRADDLPVSYLWDYNGLFQTCKADAADYTAIAATSFEADGRGQFSFSGVPVADTTAPTGKKAYALATGSIVRAGLAAGQTYRVSYWCKGGTAQSVSGSTSAAAIRSNNGWTLFEHRVVNPAGGQVTLSGTGVIDELRLFPEGAQLTTFTFNPLVGVTSQCDATGKILYYDYDDLNRLRYIRDPDKGIVKRICYNFAGTAEVCD